MGIDTTDPVDKVKEYAGKHKTKQNTLMQPAPMNTHIEENEPEAVRDIQEKEQPSRIDELFKNASEEHEKRRNQGNKTPGIAKNPENERNPQMRLPGGLPNIGSNMCFMLAPMHMLASVIKVDKTKPQHGIMKLIDETNPIYDPIFYNYLFQNLNLKKLGSIKEGVCPIGIICILYL